MRLFSSVVALSVSVLELKRRNIGLEIQWSGRSNNRHCGCVMSTDIASVERKTTAKNLPECALSVCDDGVGSAKRWREGLLLLLQSKCLVLLRDQSDGSNESDERCGCCKGSREKI